MLERVVRYASAVLLTEVSEQYTLELESSSRPQFHERLNSLANRCLEPLRYLLDGHSLTFYLTRDRTIQSVSRQDLPEKSWGKIAYKIVLVFPLTALGIALKLCALTSYESRQNVVQATRYLSSLQRLQVANAYLAKNYISINREREAFLVYLENNRDKQNRIWNEKETLERFDALITKAATSMQEWRRELFEVSGGSPKEMARLLFSKNSDRRGSHFAYTFFNCSIWDIYDCARNYLYYEIEIDPGQGSAKSLLNDASLTTEIQKPFFERETKAGRWRELYNKEVAAWDDLLNMENGEEDSLCDIIPPRFAFYFVNKDTCTTDENKNFELYRGRPPSLEVPYLIAKML